MSYAFVTDGLVDLHSKMSKATLDWPADFSTAYSFNSEAKGLLSRRAMADTPSHTLWSDAYMKTSIVDTFDALFWIKSFEYIADKFSVPMSWVAALRLYAHADATLGDKWGVKPLPSFVDEEGYCHESLWAAHLDGLSAGLVTTEEFPFVRDPKAIEFSEEALKNATKQAESMDMDVDDYLASIDDETLDMMLPTRGDDE